MKTVSHTWETIEHAQFPDRVRFNWGYHDGVFDARRGLAPMHNRNGIKDEDHFDQVYVAGVRAGMAAEKKAPGASPATSNEAWWRYRP